MPSTTKSVSETAGVEAGSLSPASLPPARDEHTHEVCPNCGASQCAGLIAFTMKPVPLGGWPIEKVQEIHGNSRCYSKTVGIELALDHPDHYDGVSYWLYPCCGKVYNRFTGEEMDWHQHDLPREELEELKKRHVEEDHDQHDPALD